MPPYERYDTAKMTVCVCILYYAERNAQEERNTQNTHKMLTFRWAVIYAYYVEVLQLPAYAVASFLFTLLAHIHSCLSVCVCVFALRICSKLLRTKEWRKRERARASCCSYDPLIYLCSKYEHSLNIYALHDSITQIYVSFRCSFVMWFDGTYASRVNWNAFPHFKN